LKSAAVAVILLHVSRDVPKKLIILEAVLQLRRTVWNFGANVAIVEALSEVASPSTLAVMLSVATVTGQM
jgi:hypothetical protein